MYVCIRCFKSVKISSHYGMILQNLDVVSEKSPKIWFLSLISFRRHVAKCRGIFYCRRTCVVWQNLEKIGAETETAEKRVFGDRKKNSTQNIMVVPLLYRERPQ